MVAGTGVVTLAVANPEDHRPDVAAEPATMHSVKLVDKGTGRQGVDRRETETFSLLGVSWPNPAKKLDGQAEVRTRNVETGEWTGWRMLELDSHSPETSEGRTAKARGATEPRWVDLSDGVEARVVASDGSTSNGLPPGMRLDLVDPGITEDEAELANTAADFQPAAFAVDDPAQDAESTATEATGSPSPSESETTGETATETVTESTGDASPSESASETASESPSPTATVPTAPESTVTQPPIVSRSAWGADESIVDDDPAYLEKIDAAFVHHTAEDNSYSCADSPAIIRSIMTFHVKSLGWNDIGYNFIVDKCGTVYEGRAGGIDLPVQGAHTYGFNGYSTGISVLGNYSVGGKATARITDAVSRVAAWKLGQYGVNPAGKVTLTAKADTGVWKEGDQATLDTISGHRDAFATECPGDALYTKLGEIRRFAAGPAANSAVPTSDLDRDGLTDLVAGIPKATAGGKSGSGTVTVVPGGKDGLIGSAKRTISQGSPGVPGGNETGDAFGASTAYGDVNGDGHADLVIGSPDEEYGSGGTNHGVITVLYGPQLDSGKALLTPVADQTEYARFGSAVAVADVDSDGRADIVSVSRGKPGKWWLFDGASLAVKGSGYLNTSAYGSSVISPDIATGDFDRDGYLDAAISYRDPGKVGRLLVLTGSTDGLKRFGILATKGGRAVDAGDINGDGYADLVIGQPYAAESGSFRGGQITVLPGSADGLTATGKKIFHQDTSGVPGRAEAGDALGRSVSVGDVDGDGYADVLAGLPLEDLTRSGTNRSNAGMVILLHGGSSGLMASGAKGYHQDTSGIRGVSESYDHFGWSVQLADVSGWGRLDLTIGVDGEDSGNGMLFHLPAGSSGITPSDGYNLTRSTLGTPAGARLGHTLAP